MDSRISEGLELGSDFIIGHGIPGITSRNESGLAPPGSVGAVDNYRSRVLPLLKVEVYRVCLFVNGENNLAGVLQHFLVCLRYLSKNDEVLFLMFLLS